MILNGFVVAVIAMLTAGTLMKFREVREVARWPKTSGLIVKSGSESRSIVTHIEPGGHSDSSQRRSRATTEVRNFAAVAFDYSVGGSHYTGTRISIRADPGNVGVAETQARYPVGKKIDVYYDPENPRRSVLERDFPDGAFQFMVLPIVFLVAADIFVNLNVGPVAGFLTGLVPAKRFAGAAVSLGFMGVFFLLFAAVLWRKVAEGNSWLVVEAEIIDPSSNPELLLGIDRSDSWTVYRYKVDGVVYISDSSSFADAVKGYFGSTPPRRTDPRAGQKIAVYVDPMNPARSVRNRGYGGVVFLVFVAAGLLGAAVHLGGFA
ncbi:DUF3592 domain-containing protein [Bradyrhizobium sp. CCGUVB23]|uniref:DUF3592 domain-containing protein n=1 Tax=Bradyrhizobium sp. CCGUVB23 TaxID=2949630 RepID=UPI0020B214F7|nr:DUF3592 domain-containing protein [Bradyrhizobium sp. CCGUVB23]MCP3465939.1 DUF3592 domain-containing protein [Bradyrhizobium sp. CCGUVB23]